MAHRASTKNENRYRAKAPLNSFFSSSSAGQMSRVITRKMFDPKPEMPLPSMTAAIYFGGKAAAIM